MNGSFFGMILLFIGIDIANGQKYQSDVIKKINNARNEANLSPICYSEQLTKVAKAYADKQAGINQGGHYIDGTTPEERSAGIGLTSELLFEGYGSSGAGMTLTMITALFNAPRQKAIMLGTRATHVGIARSATTDGAGQPYYYWVLLVGQLSFPCEPNNLLNSKEKSLADYMAPPERKTVTRRIVAEPMAGTFGVDTTEEVKKTFLDTVPRIVDGSKPPGTYNPIPPQPKSQVKTEITYANPYYVQRPATYYYDSQPAMPVARGQQREGFGNPELFW